MKTAVLIILAILMVVLIFGCCMLIYHSIKESIYHYKHREFYKTLESQLDSTRQRLLSQELSNVSNKSYDDLLKESNDLIQFGTNARVYFPVRGII